VSPGRRAFSLIELLVVIAITTLLVGVLVPSLGAARDTALEVQCLSQVRQLVTGWTLYANDSSGRAMPLHEPGRFSPPPPFGTGEREDEVYWFGAIAPDRVEYARGFLTPYLDAPHGAYSIYECPAQPWGSYTPQTAFDQPTSTYGYNGYYLSPEKTPGWRGTIASRPWQRLSTIVRPTEVMVFADTLIALGARARSTALLDPPRLFDGGDWLENDSPTTCFRHAGRASAAHADGSAAAHQPDRGAVYNVAFDIGSVSTENAPHYIPDAREW